MASEETILPFVKEDIYYELRCLLGAATVWTAFSKQEAGFDVIVAMDCAFVHVRNLFNFFTCPKGGNDVSMTKLGPEEPYESELYRVWKRSLNRHVLHISKGRGSPTNLKGGEHLNEQVLPFATEILQLWTRLEKDPAAATYTSALEKARRDAIQDAKNDARGRVEPLFA